MKLDVLQWVVWWSRKHDRQWFMRAWLGLAQLSHCLIATGVAHQVITTNTLDRDNLTTLQSLYGRSQ